MKFERASGILLHPTSLPGPYGIGDLGPSAYHWIDWLTEAGCKLWQVLPLGPTGYGDSPYQCFSAFAGNPLLISLEDLLKDQLLNPDDLATMPQFDSHRVDYGSLIPWKIGLLEIAFSRFIVELAKSNLGSSAKSDYLTSDTDHFNSSISLKSGFASFCKRNESWLDDYCLFMALKEAQGGGSWVDWPESLRKRDPDAIKDVRKSLAASIKRFSFYQFVFYRQWSAVINYAHKKGLRIIGDVPIFVSYDSADVWSHPELFILDSKLKPTVVAGVPPDYFSPTGQLWGNPLYRWDIHKSTEYQWWLDRLRAALSQVDFLRIDHFRGFAEYWEIPAD